MRSLIMMAAALFLLVGALWVFVRDDTFTSDNTEPLVVYCAAGVAPEVAQVAMAYHRRFGQAVRLELGGSGTLLSRIRVQDAGDVFIAGDVSYVQRARDEGVVREVFSIAGLVPTLAVAKGNPKSISGLDDLLRRDVKYTLASPESAAIGRLLRDRLMGDGRWDQLRQGAHTFKPTVEDVANDVALGVVDAGVVWHPVARRSPKLDAVHLPTLAVNPLTVTAGVMENTSDSVGALRWVRFLSGSRAGLSVFEAAGYEPIGGDPFDESPKVLLFCGAMMRAGVDDSIEAFERREGVRVDRIYNGCGILVSQMAAGARPDAYVTCDRSFMAQVRDLFGDEQELTSNAIVIAVRRGNPLGIRSLRDLARNSLKIGLGHPTQSALGALTDRLLREAADRDAVLRNRALESATGDLLVSQMRVGHLDAVVVYRSNVLSNPRNLQDLELVAIDHELALAHQTYAVGRSTAQPQIVKRLLQAVSSRDTRESFEALGFEYLGAGK